MKNLVFFKINYGKHFINIKNKISLYYEYDLIKTSFTLCLLFIVFIMFMLVYL